MGYNQDSSVEVHFILFGVPYFKGSEILGYFRDHP